MNVQKTSLNAYKKIEKSLTRRQISVYHALESITDMTNSELAEYLRWSINRVTPRVGELRKLDLVAYAGKRKCRITGERVKSWRPINPGKARQMEMRFNS